MRKIYLDHAAGKPVDPRVLEVTKPYYTEIFGNPSSLHSWGSEPRKAIDEARTNIVDLIGAEKKEEIIFTSGGTESNNLGIKGITYRNRKKGNHIIISAIEHISILNIGKFLTKNGFRVSIIPVDDYGFVDVEALKEEITKETILISVQYANGEVGTIQPINEIGEIAHDHDIYLHADGVAAVGQVPINVEEENIDLLSISSNDLYGPKGTGALYIKHRTRLETIMHGGGQEHGWRSGTENTPNIVGMGKAAELAKLEMPKESKRLTKLRDKLINGLLSSIDESFLNGHPTKRLPNNANVRFSWIEGESMILSLNMVGIATASSSACTSKTLEPSHVLIAMGIPHEKVHGALLMTLGKSNSEEDIDYVITNLQDIVARLRAISPLTPKK